LYFVSKAVDVYYSMTIAASFIHEGNLATQNAMLYNLPYLEQAGNVTLQCTPTLLVTSNDI